MEPNFPVAGEICKCCQERWESKKQKPRRLIDLPKVTMVYRQKVAVCPFCDGEPIIEICNYNYAKEEG